ncbi:MAG: DUF5916 domain-containing protein [Pseudomonadota bacterium]
MLRIIFAGAIACALLLISNPAAAQVEYWVSVSSFQQQNNAERGLREAQARLSEKFAIIGKETGIGYYYRVAAGPFNTREDAESRVLAARDAGFGAAWLWVDQAATFADNLVLEASSTNDYDDLDRALSELGFDETDDLYAPTQSLDTDQDATLLRGQPVPEIVEEAPEGYQLNKLRRDALARPPPAPDDPAGASTVPSRSLPSSVLSRTSPIVLPKYSETQLNLEIDGVLDEFPWTDIPGVDNFRVIDPDTVAVPRHDTLVKMFYTDKGIYAAFEMEQPVDTLVQRFSSRDAGRLNRDNVGITLDTSGEGRYGYWVNLALGGNQVDGTVLPEKQFSGDWDGAWYGGTQRTDKGWNAELFLPWSQVAMPRESGERVINAYASRKVAYIDERWSVPALPFTQPLFLSALQPLVVESVNPTQQWSVFPYLAVTQDEVEGFTDNKVGGDLFWRPSTNFQLTATLNPDFGNVESDDVIINLSAFETFFPEKRLFFQESTEVFNATPRARDDDRLTLLNTRRIGGRPRTPDVPAGVSVPARELGQPIELVGAAKVVGQMGKVRYGLLAASEDEAKFDVGALNFYQEGSDYGVARFLYEHKTAAGGYRALGSMSTLATDSLEDAIAHGIDYHYLSAGGAWKLDGQLLYSDTEDLGTGYGGFVDIDYTVRRGLRLRTQISHFDERLDINDLGFLRRNDATNVGFSVRYERSDLGWVRKASVRSFVEVEENGQGETTRLGYGARMGFDLHRRDEVRLNLAYFPERFEDRNSRGNGSYRIQGRHAVNFEYNTDSAKKISYRLGLAHNGEELGGENIRGSLGVNWRPVDRFNLGARAEYVRRDGWLLWRDERNFTTFGSREWRPRLNLDYFLTAKQQLRLSAQWVGIKAREDEFFEVPAIPGDLRAVPKPTPTTDDFAISRVNLQLRYRWELAPLSDLFVVYTLNGEDNAIGVGFDDLFDNAIDEPVGEQLVLKLRYRMGT